MVLVGIVRIVALSLCGKVPTLETLRRRLTHPATSLKLNRVKNNSPRIGLRHRTSLLVQNPKGTVLVREPRRTTAVRSSKQRLTHPDGLQPLATLLLSRVMEGVTRQLTLRRTVSERTRVRGVGNEWLFCECGNPLMNCRMHCMVLLNDSGHVGQFLLIFQVPVPRLVIVSGRSS